MMFKQREKSYGPEEVFQARAFFSAVNSNHNKGGHRHNLYSENRQTRYPDKTLSMLHSCLTSSQSGCSTWKTSIAIRSTPCL